MNPDKPNSEKPKDLPKDASPWLKQAYEASLQCDPDTALSEAVKLVALLKKRIRRVQPAVPTNVLPELEGVRWAYIGDCHHFDPSLDPKKIIQFGRAQGWEITINKIKKTGRRRAMAVAALPRYDRGG